MISPVLVIQSNCYPTNDYRKRRQFMYNGIAYSMHRVGVFSAMLELCISISVSRVQDAINYHFIVMGFLQTVISQQRVLWHGLNSFGRTKFRKPSNNAYIQLFRHDWHMERKNCAVADAADPWLKFLQLLSIFDYFPKASYLVMGCIGNLISFLTRLAA